MHGLRIATNGVVIATEKKVPTTLIEEESIQKIVPLSENIGMRHERNTSFLAAVYSGMGPDFRIITKKAQKKANTYYATFHVGASAAE